MDQETYWNGRYINEGMIWGAKPCLAAILAEKAFKASQKKKILVSGCGSGRNSLYLAQKGCEVEGFDISERGIEIAKENAKKEGIAIKYWHDNILNKDLEVKLNNIYDGILSINMLHLFKQQQREEILLSFHKLLKKDGLLICTSMSTHDADYGKGTKIDEYTYESKPGRPVYYFMETTFSQFISKYFDIKHIEEIKEFENHGGRAHYHHMYYVVAQKRVSGLI